MTLFERLFRRFRFGKKHGFRSARIRGKVRRRQSVFLEFLEDRVVPTVYTVNLLSDTGAGSGTAGDLRYAITKANQAGGTNSIYFGVAGTIQLSSDLPAIGNNLTINGLGSSRLTIAGGGSGSDFRAFYVSAGYTVSISGLTISGFNIPDQPGAAIFNRGTLTVSNSVLTGNLASGGGAIENYGGLTINSTIISNNYVFSDGGGVENYGTATISGSTLSGNTAGNYGGGLYTSDYSSNTVINSTISSNHARYGGGVDIEVHSTVVITGSTVANNTASQFGGGIDFYNGSLTVTSSTISGNTAPQGGGVKNFNNGTFALNDTIVAGNSASTGPDILGNVNSGGANLIGTNDGLTGLANAFNGNLVGVNPIDPLLSPLGNYGGPTQTFALLPGSPALNAGDSNASSTDQRGVSRPQGGQSPSIGAFESHGFTLSVGSGNNQFTGPNQAFATPVVATVTANDPSEPVAGGVVDFSAPSSGATAILSDTQTTIAANGTASVTATANGSYGTYSVTASINGSQNASQSFLYFNGTSGFVQLPTGAGSTDFTNGFTAGVWVYPTADQNWERFLDLGNGYSSDNIILARNGTSNDLVFQVYQGGAAGAVVTASNAITLNTWQFLAVTLDGSGNATLYKDGNIVATGTTSVPLNVTRTNNYLGKSNWNSDSLFQGQMADLGIWNSVLTQDQIQAGMPNSRVPITQTGLVGYWPLETISGSLTPDIGPNHYAATTNSGVFATGQVSTALNFNGSSGFVQLPSSGMSNFTGGFSAGVWVYPTADQNWERILDLGNGSPNDNIVFARNGTTNSLTFQVYRGGTAGVQVSASNAITLNQWQYFAVTLDGSGNVKLYKNGQVIATGTTSVPRNVTRSNDYVGKSNWSTDALFQGQMSNLGIWTSALTQAQIQASMVSTTPVTYSNLVGYWPLAAVSGTSTPDIGPNGLNGTTNSGISAGPLASATQIASVLNFNGSSGFVQLPSGGLSNFTGGFSAGVWVYPTADTSWARILDLGNGSYGDNIVFARNGTTNDLVFQTYQGGTAGNVVSASNAISLNQWQYFAATLDGSGNVKLYKNGQVIATGTTLVPRNVTRNNDYIGKSNWSSDSLFQGQMSNLGIWSSALTQAQIQASMLATAPVTQTGLVGYWPLATVSGTSTPDIGSGNHTGTTNSGISVSGPVSSVAPDVSFTLTNASLVVNTAGTAVGTGLNPLSQAIAYANTFTSGPAEITFDPAVFSTPQTIQLTGTLPALTDTAATIKITGPGAGQLTIAGGGDSSNFRALVINSGVTASLSGLTISGFHVTGDGGAILDSGTLTITDSTVAGNKASQRGGGIYSTGTLSLSRSTITGNQAIEGGGLYFAYGQASLSDSTISNNIASNSGGGIQSDRATLAITGSTLLNNAANSTGIYTTGGAVFASNGTTTITNSTITGNSAIDGGGVYNGGTMTLVSDTISGNTNSIPGNVASGTGGGVWSKSGQVLNVSDTIIAGNSSPGAADVAGTISSGSANLIGGAPLLSPLGYYGGVTQTMALLAGSPAIAAGDSHAASTDQRGFTRPGGSSNSIGAFQYSASLVVNSTSGTGVSGYLTLPDALNLANTATSGTANITFDPTVFSAPQTINLNSTLTFSNTSAVEEITGPGASLVTIAGGGWGSNYRGIVVNGGVTAMLSGVTVAGFHTQGADGAGINNGGNLTITSSLISGNVAELQNGQYPTGGGIYNTGTLLISNATLSHNSAYLGTALINFGTTTITGSTISNNDGGYSGAIDDADSGTLTINNSTLSGNHASNKGGALYVRGTTNVTNTTFSGNSSGSDGGAISVLRGSLTLTSSTISGNSALSEGGGIYKNFYQGTITLHDTIVSGNSASTGSNIYGAISNASSANLIDGSALLAPLGDYGGSTQTMPLLPGSPALNAGDSFATSTDQRGVARPGGSSNDIGAFQSQGFTLSYVSGSGQTGFAYGQFANPLLVQVTANDPAEPVAGGLVNFTAPGSGATATVAPATIATDGKAGGVAVANNQTGSYTVTAQAYGVTGSASFNLTNATSLVVSSTSDDPSTSSGNTLRQALIYANSLTSGTADITFDPTVFSTPQTIHLTSTLVVSNTAVEVDITGPGANLVTIAGGGWGSDYRGLMVNSGVTAVLSGVTVAGFHTQGANGAGINNGGNLTITSSLISGNVAETQNGQYPTGGGIYNTGTLSLSGSTVSNNSAYLGTALINFGTATITGSTISGNNGGYSGAIDDADSGTLTINNSTLSGNQAGNQGGALYVRGTTNVTNTTFSGNSSGSDGGAISVLRGSLTLTSSTISGNSASSEGGGIYKNHYQGTITLHDTIVSGNNASTGSNIYGSISGSSNHNLIDGNALLAPLSDFGGPTQTMAVLPGSPAINGGDSYADGTDQRGFSRPGGSSNTIGAFQYVANPSLVVNTTSETAPEGKTSLVDAINLANIYVTSGTADITFDPAIFSTPQTITLSQSLPTFTNTQATVEISGPGAGLLTLHGGGPYWGRALNVASGTTVVVSGLTFQGFVTAGNGAVAENFGNLTFLQSVLTGNTTYQNNGTHGGAISNGGTLTIDRSTISNNYAYWGGAIFNVGTATITNSTLSGDSAYGGGAIMNANTLTLTSSTLTGNQGWRGGALYNASGHSEVINSTFANNFARFYGGGLAVWGGWATVTSSTLSGNTSGNIAGGIYARAYVALNDSIVAGNSPSQISGNVAGNANLFGGDLRLSPLGDYGGTTQTFALLPGSPAIGAGDSNAASTDQRGIARPGGSSNDVGAFQTTGSSIVVNTASVTPAYGAVTLIQAITLANTYTSGTANITFDAGVFSTPQTIQLTGTLPALADTAAAIAITGPGAGLVTIQGGGASSNFRAFTVNSGVTASLSGLTVTGFTANGNGGAIQNVGTLTLNNATVSGNTAYGTVPGTFRFFTGGGIYSSGTLTLSGATVSGNSAPFGGGIYADSGTTTISGSTITNNQTTGQGGGFYLNYGSAIITNSTISNNTSDYRGGGLANYRGSLTVIGSTISGNSSLRIGGGGLYSYGTGSTTTIKNSTFTGNTASNGVGGAMSGAKTNLNVVSTTISGNSAQTGGGIYNGYLSNLALQDTIVAGNTAATSADLFSDPTATVSGSANLIGDGTYSGFSNGVAGNIVGTTASPINPLLSPLGDYGGITQTMALLPGSPAIAAGDGNAASTDQRGLARPGVSRNDIGAFQTTGSSIVVNAGNDTPAQGYVTLPQAINLANTYTSGTATISFASTVHTIQLTQGLPALTDTAAAIAITGPGANLLTIQGGGAGSYFRAFRVNTGVTASISGLTVTGFTVNGNGGAIQNVGTLTLNNSVVSGNTANGGGGIYSSGSLSITRSTITGNTAGFAGGGIGSQGTLAVTYSTISGNSAGFQGGGIYANGTLTISNSTISSNHANGNGGGIQTGNNTTTITNSSITNNSSSYAGGIDDYRGTLIITSSTISGNVASSVGGVALYLAPSVVLNDTIIAGNTASNVSDYSDYHGVTTGTSNLIGDGTGSHLTNGVNGNIVGTTASPINPLLSPLGDYGGVTQTMALLPGSPAIAAGDGNAASTDQRGIVRPGGSSNDIGAFQTTGSSIVVNTASLTPAQGNVTLPQAINLANTYTSGTATISFASAVHSIQLSGTLPALTNTAAAIAITGPGASLLTIHGGGNGSDFQGFIINSGVTASLSDLTLSGFHTSSSSGGAINNAGTLTISAATVSGNTGIRGGGIYSTGTLTLTGSTVSGNTANHGGGIYASYGVTTISSSTITGNQTTGYGGGFYLNAGSATISNSTISNNNATQYGGGLTVWEGTLTVTGSTISGNSSLIHGGGGLSAYGTRSSVTIQNSTFTGNTAAQGAGGAIYDFDAPLNIVSTTITGNSAQTGGGISDNGSSSLTLNDTIVAGNTATGGPADIDANNIASLTGSANLIGDGTGSPFSNGVNGNIVGTTASPINPRLSALGNYGGPTQTFALLPGSPALDAGNGNAASTDQRGVSRPQWTAADIGAFESHGFTITLTSGNNQFAHLNTQFAAPLVVTVTANDPTEPVAGGVVKFTAPGSGSSASFAGNPATIGSNGTASVTATANSTLGSYTVSTAGPGVTSAAQFSLINILNLVVNTTSASLTPGSGLLSLPGAMAYANQTVAGGTEITFDPTVFNTAQTIQLTQSLPGFTNTAAFETITGPGANLLTIQGGGDGSNFNGLNVAAGVTASLSGLTFTGFVSAGSGGAVANSGTLTLKGVALSQNTANQGGGVYSNGTLTITGSTIAGNTAQTGGGIYISRGHVLAVTNSTITGNAAVADVGGGIYSYGATSTIISTTIVGNSATLGAGGIEGATGSNTLTDSIVYGNTVGFASPDLVGIFGGTSNLIGDISGSQGITNGVNGNQVGVNPLLSALGYYGGSTQTFALLPGSPALNAGDANAASTDQRGVNRPQNGLSPSIGAFESHGFTIKVTSGDQQYSAVNTAFSAPLVATVTANDPTEPVAGGVVTFTAPAAGQSATLSANQATIGADGTASVTATANATLGSYQVSASINGGQVTSHAVLAFDGTTGFVQLPSAVGSTNFTQGFSAGVWVYPTANANWARILDLGNGPDSDNIVLARNGTSNNLVFQVYQGSTQGAIVTASGALTLNQWQYIAVTLDGSGNVTLYKNGQVIASGTTLVPLNVTRSNDYLGKSNWDSDALFQGQMTDLGIWNSVLTQAQVQASMANSGTPVTSTGLVGYWPLATVTGTSTPDIGPNQWNATVNSGISVAQSLATPDAMFTLTNASLVVNTASATGGTGLSTLAQAIAYANTFTSGTADITFDSGVFSTAQTIQLTQALPDLSSTAAAIEITGPGANLLTIAGGGAGSNFRAFTIDAGVTASISGLTVSGFSVNGNGGAILNAGTLTLTGSTISNSTVYGGPFLFWLYVGGGIYNSGVLTVNNSTISGNSAPFGGGIYGYQGTTTISDSTISGNDASHVGGGVFQLYGSLTISNSTVSANTSYLFGGGLDNYRGTLVLTGSTISGNSGSDGGGLNSYQGSAAITDCTFAGNTASNGQGGAINSIYNSLSLISTTISGNAANTAGGIAIYNAPSVVLYDTIVAGNSAGSHADIQGVITAGTSNLIGTNDGMSGLTNGQNGNIVGTNNSRINPLLSALGNYGGSTQTFALLPGSPALDAGDANAASTDQRGVSRPQGSSNDIGAFESHGFTISTTSGSGQSAYLNAAFGAPLVATVTANDPLEPVAGGVMSLSAPGSGATVSFSSNHATIGSDRTASITATARGDAGAYSVTASALGVSNTASFSLTNLSLVVNTTSTSLTPGAGLLSLPLAIQYANLTTSGTAVVSFDSTIFSTAQTITLTQTLPDITATLASVEITGPGANLLTLQASGSGFRAFTIDAGVTGTISGLTISGFGLNGGHGAGVDNAGTLSLNAVVLSNNTGAYDGGAVYSNGNLTITGSTISGNSASNSGGGVFLSPGHALSMVNSTVTGNMATYGAGGGVYGYAATTTVTSSTIVGNSAGYAGGGIVSANGSGVLYDTIAAGNSSAHAPDLAGPFSGTSNLIGTTQGSSGISNGVNGNQVGVNPLLSALGNYGGPTPTMALLPGSPALDAGDASAASTDQRGVSRPQGSSNDIGAFESQGFTISVSSGGTQSAYLMSQFGNPLVISVTANDPSEPVAGGVVTFTVPGSGPTATPSSNTATIGQNGTASVTATANSELGSYVVTATALGATNTADFNLTNTALIVNTNSGSLAPGAGLLSLPLAIQYAEQAPEGSLTISFDPTVFSTAQTIQLSQSLPELSNTLTTLEIIGPGASLLSILGGGAGSNFRAFTIDAGVTVHISGLTVSGFQVNGDGGAVYNAGTLTLSNSVVSGNTAGGGGGIMGYYGTLTLSNSVVSGNSAHFGGGIDSYGSLSITGSAITGNTARGSAGGIACGGTLTVTSSTISANYSGTQGGGIYASGTTTISNSTISSNHAWGNGGGILTANNTTTISNSTIANNTSFYAAGIDDYQGALTITSSTISGNVANAAGGIGIYHAPSVVLDDTIVAGNSAGSYADIEGVITGGTSNLIGTDAGMSGLTNGVNGNLVGTNASPINPLLSALGNYGGSTQTMALLPGSPALDAGDTNAASTDQRGVSRPQGSAADIGAFESHGFTIAATAGTNQHAQITNAFSNPLLATVTANDSSEPVAGGIVNFTAPGSGASATLSSNLVAIGNNGKASVTATANATTGSYSINVTATGAAPASFNLTNILASTTTTVSSSASTTLYGTSVTFTATVTSSTVGVSGTVQFFDGATLLGSGTLLSGTATFSTSALAAGVHSITAVYSGDAVHVGSTSSAITQTVNRAPVVTAHPAGSTVNAGATATFTTAATGYPVPTVQWQISTNGGSTWTNITGATSTTYTTPATTAANDGAQYRALFVNVAGSAVTSSATLKVNQAATVTTQPASITANTGAVVSFTAAATGTPAPTVQWQINTGSGWNNIQGATSTTYSFTVVSGQNGNQFRAVFSNTFGGTTYTATTSAATLSTAAVAQVTGTSVGWGIKTASLVDKGDGRLLPAGRLVDMPWLNINTITVTVSPAISTPLQLSNVKLTGVVAGTSYTVKSVTGSGTTWTITFANNSATPTVASKGIINADKVTLTVTNSQITTFSRRLDVLPGDVNDDGVVNSVDMVAVQQQISLPYIAFFDVDGSDNVSATDTTLVKSKIGTKLPS